MAFTGSAALKFPRHIEVAGGVEALELATNLSLTYKSAQYLILKNTTGGALNCTLPAEREGAYFWILNRSSSSQNVSVNRPDASGAATLIPGECGLFVCDGTIWEQMIKA